MADYIGVLAELRTRRDAIALELRELDTAIAALQRLSGASTFTSHATIATVPAVSLAAMPSFRGSTLSQAVERYLRAIQQPVTTREVHEALKRGGFPADAKSFQNQVYNALNRMAQPGGIVRRADNKWILADPIEPMPSLLGRDEAH